MLTKLRIIAYPEPAARSLSAIDWKTDPSRLALSKLSEFVAYFNPESLSIQVGRRLKERPTTDGNKGTEDGGVDNTTYSFKLVIDGTGVSGPKIPSVKAEVDKFIAFSQLVSPVASEKPIPYLDLIWGDFYVQCQLQSLSINYTLFDAQGRPLRASLDCSFMEIGASALKEGDFNTEQQALLQVGESLVAKVGKDVNGMAQVIDIARKNGLDSLRGARAASTSIF